MVTTNKELSSAMALDLQKKIEDVVNTNKDIDHYFILVTLGMEEGALRNTLFILPPYKARMLLATPLKATMMFEVDNKKGFAKWVWCLPKDMPGQGDYHGGNEFVHDCSQYVPIRN